MTPAYVAKCGASPAFGKGYTRQLVTRSRELPSLRRIRPNCDFTNIDRDFHEFRRLGALTSGTSAEKRSSYN
jgi:hypothetical protein